VKCDLKADRTSAQSFLANFGRLLLTAGAYVLHQQLRQLGLQGTALATAQPRTVILSLFKIAVRVKQYKAGCCCICPVPARLKRCWRRSASVSIRQTAGCAPCWLLHDSARLAHETMPPTLINNYFTLHPASGGWGIVG